MPTPEQTKLHDLLCEFEVGMLVTQSGDGGLHARPMAIAEVEGDCTTWFVTSRSSPKVDEVNRSSRAYVVCQRGSKAFLTLSGEAHVVEDRAKLEELWKVQYQAWFPKGKDDPDLSLLRVTPDGGEYWDNRGLRAFKYVLEAGRAVVTGTRPAIDEPAQHGRARL